MQARHKITLQGFPAVNPDIIPSKNPSVTPIVVIVCITRSESNIFAKYPYSLFYFKNLLKRAA